MTTRLALAFMLVYAPSGLAQAANSAQWDSVGRILQAPATPTSGYTRYNFPRKDITLKIGDVTVSPSLALGAWAGFSGDPAHATMMGDLVLLSRELKAVQAALVQQDIMVAAVHNHLAGESPTITYMHFHAEGSAFDLAARLNRALAQTAIPRPVVTAAPAPATIDTSLVFNTLGIRGKGQGNVAQVSANLVPGDVTMNGKVVNPAMAYGTPINIQMVSPSRAVATGDFSVLSGKVDAVTAALATNGIEVTAVHSHLVGEQPQIRYIHFWADGTLPDVLRGLKAALDAAK